MGFLRKKPHLSDLLEEIEKQEMACKKEIIEKYFETRDLEKIDLLRLYLITFQTLLLEKELSKKLKEDLTESERTLNFLKRKNES